MATSLNNPDRWGASWPPAGRKDGHQWGEKVAADGEKPMAIDSASRTSVLLRTGQTPVRAEVSRPSTRHSVQLGVPKAHESRAEPASQLAPRAMRTRAPCQVCAASTLLARREADQCPVGAPCNRVTTGILGLPRSPERPAFFGLSIDVLGAVPTGDRGRCARWTPRCSGASSMLASPTNDAPRRSLRTGSPLRWLLDRHGDGRAGCLV